MVSPTCTRLLSGTEWRGLLSGMCEGSVVIFRFLFTPSTNKSDLRGYQNTCEAIFLCYLSVCEPSFHTKCEKKEHPFPNAQVGCFFRCDPDFLLYNYTHRHYPNSAKSIPLAAGSDPLPNARRAPVVVVVLADGYLLRRTRGWPSEEWPQIGRAYGCRGTGKPHRIAPIRLLIHMSDDTIIHMEGDSSSNLHVHSMCISSLFF